MRDFFALALGFACVAVATGGDVALLWSKAPTSGAPWTARMSHAAGIFADGTVLSLGGYDGVSKNDVFRLTPGSTTLEQVTAAAAWSARNGFCAVVLLGTDEIVIMGGFGSTYFNDAWRSTDKGATFVKISDAVWAQGRQFAGCVAISATKLFAFGGGSGYHNDIRVSIDAGASWSDVDHASCGAMPPMWSERYNFGYTYMALLGRIVIAGGTGFNGVLHNDIWYSQSDATCWTLAKADVNIASDGYYGASLVTVPFGGVEALLLMGGINRAFVYLNTVQLSLDGGFTWSVVASAKSGGKWNWLGRRSFTAIVDSVSARLLMWGGVRLASSQYKGDLWTTSLIPIYDAILPMIRPFTVSLAVCADTQGCRVTGNQQLTVRGTNFTDAATDLAISIGTGGDMCTSIQVINDNKITCTTPCFTAWSSTHSITITSSTAPGGFFDTTNVSVAAATKYPGKSIADFVCFIAPIITSVACNSPAACSVTTSPGMAPQLKVPPNELVTITGANFGAIEPNKNIDVTIAKMYFGMRNCIQTVTLWSATSITLRMCATSGTKLPINITLGTKKSPPFATVIKVKAVVECDAGRFCSSLCTTIPSMTPLTSPPSSQRFLQQ
jgi:hypothetical protein